MLGKPGVSLFRQLKDAPSRLLMLDYDGTLAPFTAARNSARPYSGIEPLLKNLLKCRRTRLVIISGRTLSDLEGLLKIGPPLEMWGSHGCEVRHPGGQKIFYTPCSQRIEGLIRARELIDNAGLTEQLELKPSGVALHWRGLSPDEKKRIYQWGLENLEKFAGDYSLSLMTFDGGMELRNPWRTKGHVVKTLLAQVPQGTFTAYLGDDMTDEDAFKALAGIGYGILVRRELRRTHAVYWIRPPEELEEFLTAWRETPE